jgi:hypothetical protein
MPIISNLPSLTVGTGTAYVPVVDTTGGTEVTKKASFDVIADYVIGTFGSINQASTTEYGLIKVGITLQINTVTGVLNVADSPTWVSQRLSGTIAATSPTTGTLVVSGGVGVGGAIAVAGGIKVTDGTNSLTTSSGAITVEGGIGVAKDLTIGGTLRFSNAIGSVAGNQIKILSSVDSSSTQTGALVIQGGAGVAGNVYVGGDLFVNGFEVSTSTYSLPVATPSELGGIKIGAGLLIDGSGVVTANTTTNPTPARFLQINASETQNFVSAGAIPGGGALTTNTSGLIIIRNAGGALGNSAFFGYSDLRFIGDGTTSTRGQFVASINGTEGAGLAVKYLRVFYGEPELNFLGADNTGTVLSVKGHPNYTNLVTATYHIVNKGYVDGVITTATNLVQGTIKVGNNLNIVSSVLSVATATNSVAGLVKSGTGLTAAVDGTLSVNQATTTTLGGVIVGNGLTVASGVISVNAIPSDLTVKGQSITVNSTTTSINFVGGGVTVQQSGLDVIVTIGSGGFNGGIVANTTTFASNVQSVSTNTGAVTIGGGLGVGGDIYARDIYSNGNLIGGGAGTPNGSTTEVQFRYQGTFGADSQFTYNSSTNVLAVDNIQSVAITANSFSSNSGGAPTIASTATLTLEASTASRVVVSQSPFKLAIYSVAARDLLTAENGDLIYNSTTGKFQGYAAGGWVDLH